jgi:putative PIN family toxin of toxin-antitoxin system
MRLVVLDTNVLISAGIMPGSPPARIVMDWALAGQIQTVTSPWVVGEYREVARRVKFRRYGFPPPWLEFLIEESLMLPEPGAWPHAGPDPKDLPMLALAHAAGAWLVTGNLKHFPEPIRGGVTVIPPAEFLAHLTGSVK